MKKKKKNSDKLTRNDFAEKMKFLTWCTYEYHWRCWLLLEHKLCLNQFSSVAQSCVTLCDPMNCSAPDLPVHHQLLESTQTHVH